ncbi:MAG TPA: glycosyltransferase family 2 protein [Thermoguttaceae bacterium]|nr:glycosyltransferase family 2 protein [Thermoguttaceae bacterium]
MNGRPSITAAIIALDEERNLAELLPRLDWVDEIVVIDGGSRDDTVRVARSYGCRVESRRLDTFAEQRNFALRRARGDWVFSIDADEGPTPRLAAEIRRRIASDRVNAYRVPIRSTIFGRPLRRSGTQDDCPVRLFRREAARWVGDVHEVLQVRGRIGRLENRLLHRTLPDLESFLAKMHRYTVLEANARAAMGRPPRWRDRWLAPPREIFRRLVWKQGFFDGPAGWAFCLLSGLSEWVLAGEHRRVWSEAFAGAIASERERQSACLKRIGTEETPRGCTPWGREANRPETPGSAIPGRCRQVMERSQFESAEHS